MSYAHKLHTIFKRQNTHIAVAQQVLLQFNQINTHRNIFSLCFFTLVVNLFSLHTRHRSFVTICVLAIILLFTSCKEDTVEFNDNVCKRMPLFTTQLGFASGSFFSTTDSRNMGLVLVQTQQAGNSNAPIVKQYQDSSWKKAGWLAPIVLDEVGNIFVSPAPFVSVYYNPLAKANTIFKVDTKTGKMNEWLTLPQVDSNSNNAYGIIGMVYLCEAKVLYVSTLAGSDRKNERGCIYAIDVATQKIIDKITATDAMGMGISYVEEKRKLYYGTGRSSQIYSVLLSSKGDFTSKPLPAFSITNLGPRGDDKVRRIFNNPDGTLTVAGFEFNYNLIATREKQETSYTFSFDAEEKVWNFLK
jgi:hypothetical protein